MGLQNIRPFVGLTNEQFKKTNFLSREAGSITLPSWLNFQRLSPVNVQTSASTMTALATNIAGVFYDGVIKGLLMEESRTNYAPYIAGGTGVLSNGSVSFTTGVADPLGGTAAINAQSTVDNNSYLYLGMTLPAIPIASALQMSSWLQQSAGNDQVELGWWDLGRKVQRSKLYAGTNTWARYNTEIKNTKFSFYISNSLDGSSSSAVLTIPTGYQANYTLTANGDTIQIENETVTITSGGGTGSLTVSRAAPQAHGAWTYCYDVSAGNNIPVAASYLSFWDNRAANIVYVDNLGPLQQHMGMRLYGYQCEYGLYPTSLISTTGASGITRNSSTLTSLITNSNSFQITLQDVKYCSLTQATDDPYILGNYSSDQTLAIWTDKSTGYIKVQVGAEVVTTTIQSSFVYGDIFQASIVASTNGSNSLISITVTKNFVNIGSYNCNFTTAINQVSKKLIIGSDYLGAHQFCGYLQKISGTFDGDVTDGYPGYIDFSLGSRGVVTVPSSALTFTCVSTRTCQTSATTQIEGIGSNVVCCNIFGLQHEPLSSNNVPYSETFGSWSVNGSTVNSTTLSDPAGGTTGCDITGTGGGAGGLYVGGLAGLIGSQTNITMSSWTKGADSTSKSGIGLADGSVLPITQNVEQPIIPATWHKQITTYSGTAKIANYVLINDTRITGVTTPCRGQYAKIQVEPMPFNTSYIKVPGIVATTRTATNISKSIPNDSDLIFDLEWVASHAPNVGWEAQSNALQVLASGANGYIATATGVSKIRVYNGYSAIDTTGTVSWAAGNIVRLIATTFYSLKQIKLVVYVNGSIILNETLTMNENLALLGFTANLFSNPGGAYHCSPRAVRHALVKSRVSSYPVLTSPDQFGTLLAAWDARYGIASTGGLVDSWTPYMGDASIVLAGTSTQRPTYVANRGDGRPELSFVGASSQNLSINGNAGIATIPRGNYAMVVACSNTASGATYILSLAGATPTNMLVSLQGNPGGSSIINTTKDAGVVYTGNSMAANGNPRQAIILNRSTTSIRVASNVGSTVTGATVAGSGGSENPYSLVLGGLYGAGAYGTFKISALWLYKSNLLQGAELQACAAMNSSYPVL